ncbi:MAG: AI-2E family transporter [Chloroflexi bacterium]|nr:AI-2E family transporter [Chloroflexota bacterium]
MTGFQVFRYTLIVLGTVALAALFVATLDVWIVLWLAILIASALRPSIMRLKDWGISQNVAIPIVYGGVLTISLVLLLLVVPPVVNQLVRYLQNDNLLVIRILSTQRWVEGVLGSITGSPVTLGFDLDQISLVVDRFVRALEITAPTLIGDIGGFLGNLVLIFVMGIYWINSRERVASFLVDLVPMGRQAQTRAILDEIEVGLGAYVRGIVLVSVIVGFLSFVAMAILNATGIVNIPNAGSLSFFYGLATAIPIIGGLIGVAAATGLALLSSPAAAAAVLIITFVLQQVENYYVSPRIMSSSTRFDEILVIVFIAAGFTLNGLMGGMIAIPLAATAAILLNHLIILPHKASVTPTRIDGGIVLPNSDMANR